MPGRQAAARAARMTGRCGSQKGSGAPRGAVRHRGALRGQAQAVSDFCTYTSAALLAACGAALEHSTAEAKTNRCARGKQARLQAQTGKHLGRLVDARATLRVIIAVAFFERAHTEAVSTNKF